MACLGGGHCIDINRATPDDLAHLTGIGPTRAESICEFRDALGGFTSVNDLKQVPGIGPHVVECNKNELLCTPARQTFTRRVTRSSFKTKRRHLFGRILSQQKSTKLPRKHKLAGKLESTTETTSSPPKKLCTPAKHDQTVRILPVKSYGRIKTDSTLSQSGETRCRRTSLCSQPPAGLKEWLRTFHQWGLEEKKYALEEIIDTCEPVLVRHMMGTIEPRFQRDFISLLPKELALYVLSFLGPKDLLQAAQTCKCWQLLCDDNL